MNEAVVVALLGVCTISIDALNVKLVASYDDASETTNEESWFFWLLRAVIYSWL